MVIVNHIVPDVQVRKTLNGNAVFLLFLLPFLAALAENLAVGKDSQTDIVILEAFGKRAFGHPNTAGHHFFFQVVHIDGRYVHFRQFRCHSLGTGTCPCQHQNPVILFFQILQFLTEQVCPFLERRNGTHRKIRLCFGLEVGCPLGNPCQKNTVKILCLPQNIQIIKKEFALGRKQKALCNSAFHTFLIFLPQGVHVFCQPLGFIKKKDGVLWQIGKEAYRIIIEVVNETAHGSKTEF